MALDYSVLQGMDPAGAFFRGQEAVRAEQERNMLRQMQMEQMAAQRENLLAQRQDREAQAAARRELAQRQQDEDMWLGKMADLFGQNNMPLTPETVQQGLAFALRSRNAPAIQMMQKTAEALRSQQARAQLLGEPSVETPPPTPAGAEPSALPAPNALAQQIQGLRSRQSAALAAGEKDIAAFFGSQANALEAQADPTRRFKTVGNLVFDVTTGQYVVPSALPGRAPTPAAAPRAAAAPKPAAAAKPPAEPKPATVTEQQASTATQRLLNRAQEISKVLAANKKAEAPTVVEAAMENVPLLSRATNLVRDTDRQIVSSAQDDILDALLYLSTGAAYNKEQLAQQKSAYLPSWSDNPKTREVKRRRLVQAIEGARVRAGRAWTPELDKAMNELVASPVMGGSPSKTPKRIEIAPGVFVTERP